MTDKNLIHVLDKKLALHQAPDGFRTSMDSVMLAAACPAKKGESILDLGCGVGSAGLCVLHRIANITLVGIDIQQDHIDLATENASINDMSERAQFICDDVSTMNIDRADHIICNPPYKNAEAHIKSPSTAKAKAMGHDNTDLKDWIACAHRHIKGQGSLTMIHEAEQADAIIHALYGKDGGRRFGATDIIPLYPKANKPAKRVIIRAYKHKQSGTKLYPGLILHNEDGSYTKEADHILRDAAPLY